MNILYAEKDIQVRDYISMLLEASFDCAIFEVSSEEEIHAIFDFGDHVSLFLVDIATLEKDHTQVLKAIENSKVATVVFSSDKEDADHPTVKSILELNSLNHFVVKPFKDVEFFPIMENIIESLPKDVENEAVNELIENKLFEEDEDVTGSPAIDGYHGAPQALREKTKVAQVKAIEVYDHERFKRVRLKRFLNFEKASVDIFIKLGEEKYIKLIKENEEGFKDRILNYEEKGVYYLYIENHSYEDFIKKYRELAFQNLRDTLNSSDNEKIIESQVSCYDAVIQMARDFGVNDTVIMSIEQCFQSVEMMTKKTKSLNDVIKTILEGNDYISQHSLLLSYIVGQVCSESPWATEQTMNKLVMAAILHDCALKDEKLAKVNILDEETMKKLSPNEINIVKNHPLQAASLVAGGKSIYPDVDAIISQHHEQPDQSGYPLGIGSLKISPLSCIFIISREYTDYLLQVSRYGQLNPAELKEEFRSFYNQGNFKIPLGAFLRAF